jgi:hypothetical protein
MTNKILLLLATLCILQSKSIASTYEMNDLVILHDNKNYYEFFEHALDILPSKRNAQWKEMVENTGINYLGSIITKTKLEQTDIKLIGQISLWPTLSKNEFYNKKRDHIFLKQIKTCFESNEKQCFEKAQVIYNDFKHENEFTFELIKLFSAQNIVHHKISPYAKVLSSSSFGEFYCNREPLRGILFQELQSQQSRGSIDKNDFDNDCVKAMNEFLVANLLSNSAANRKLSHNVLTTFKLLQAKDKGKFEVVSLIDGAQFSPKEFDHILAVLIGFSKDDTRRKALVLSYKKLDPLPDNLFTKTNSKKVTAKIKIIHRYFPELLDSYALTCLSYLQGLQVFPNGNPTPNCHNFFKITQSLNVLPASFISKYKKATYFIKK